MAKTRRSRRTYTSSQRSTILAAAARGKLTALDVKKKYGVTPVTYYSWRKKYRAGSWTGTSTRSTGKTNELGRQVRTEVQAKVRQILPGIVRTEVSQYLNTLFGSGRRTRRV